MVNCSILNCKNRSITGGHIQFFRFPKEEMVANAWLKYCKPATIRKSGRVCSVHFLGSDYTLKHILMNEPPLKRSRVLKPDAIPSLHLSNEIADPSCIEPPEIDILDDATEIIPSDLVLIEHNYNMTNRSVQLQSQIETHSVETQTMEKSKNTITIALSEYEDLKATKMEHQIVTKNLAHIFTPGQIRCLFTPDRRRIRWSAEDIASAFNLWSVSHDGYEYLRNVVGIPYPGISTLLNWTAQRRTANKIEHNDMTGNDEIVCDDVDTAVHNVKEEPDIKEENDTNYYQSEDVKDTNDYVKDTNDYQSDDVKDTNDYQFEDVKDTNDYQSDDVKDTNDYQCEDVKDTNDYQCEDVKDTNDYQSDDVKDINDYQYVDVKDTNDYQYVDVKDTNDYQYVDVKDTNDYLEEDLSVINNIPLEEEKKLIKGRVKKRRGPTKNKLNTKPERQVCEECGKSVADIRKHSAQHKPKKDRPVYSCKVCDKVFRSKSAKIRHNKFTHLGLKYPCKICGKEVAELGNHILRVHKPDKLKLHCYLCGRRFLRQSTLYIHMLQHTNDKPFECDKCQQQFRLKSSLEQHIRQVHNKEKSHLCHHCSKGFFKLQTLQNHLRTHTGEKPYKCEECGKAFATLTTFKQHKLTHNTDKKFQCDHCDMKFLKRNYLRNHMLRHTKEKRYSCKYCGVKFGRSDHRNRHQFTAHEKNFVTSEVTSYVDRS